MASERFSASHHEHSFSPEMSSKEPLSAIFIGGATSKTKGLGAVDGTLKGRFGKDNVSVYNSLLSVESPHPQRFIEMGKDLKKKIESGPMVAIAHSFGAAELYAAMAAIEAEDPEFFQQQEHLDNLQLLLISPTLPKNFREGMGIGARYIRIGVREGGVTFASRLPGKTRSLRGIVSEGVVPTPGVSIDALHQFTRDAAPKISHIRRGTSGTVVNYEPDAQRDYRSVLEAEFGELDDADVEVRKTLNESRRRKAQALYRRGLIATPLLNKINQNDWSSLGDTEMVYHPSETEGVGLAMQRELIKETWKGTVYEYMTKLARSGVATKLVIPEFDTMITPRKARELGTIPNIDILLASGTTHGFPWADRPELLLQLIDHPQS